MPTHRELTEKIGLKRYLVINLSDEYVGHDTFRAVCNLHPAGARRTFFQARLRDDDAVALQILDVLDAAGSRPALPAEEFGPGLFSCNPSYDYEPKDLERADYFQFIVQSYSERMAYSEDGLVQLQRSKLKKKAKLAETGKSAAIVASTPFKAALDAQDFIGLAFKPTEVVTGRLYDERKVVPWKKVGCEPFWQLTSTIRLPRLSPRCKLLDREGRRYERDEEGYGTRGAFLHEGDFPAGELHYLRSEIAQVEPFDAALTYERFGNAPQPNNEKFVVSGRFRDFLRNEKIGATWYPVYVDDE